MREKFVIHSSELKKKKTKNKPFCYIIWALHLCVIKIFKTISLCTAKQAWGCGGWEQKILCIIPSWGVKYLQRM